MGKVWAVGIPYIRPGGGGQEEGDNRRGCRRGRERGDESREKGVRRGCEEKGEGNDDQS